MTFIPVIPSSHVYPLCCVNIETAVSYPSLLCPCFALALLRLPPPHHLLLPTYLNVLICMCLSVSSGFACVANWGTKTDMLLKLLLPTPSLNHSSSTLFCINTGEIGAHSLR